MTLSDKKIAKVLTKTYNDILDIIVTDMSKKYKIDKKDLKKTLDNFHKEKDEEEK